MVLGEQAMRCDDGCRLRAGDANRDGIIDEEDLELAGSGEATTHIDYNFNGEFDEADLQLMADNLGFVSPDLTEILTAESTGAGPCRIAGAGLAETYPECLAVALAATDVVDCFARCADKAPVECESGCGGRSCASDPRACFSCQICDQYAVACTTECLVE